MGRMIKSTLLAIVATTVIASSSYGDTRKDLGTFKNWDALVETNSKGQKTCYIISMPKKTSTSQKVSSRGDTYMMISKKPTYGIAAEVSVVLGFAGKESVEATASIDGKRKNRMFMKGDAAWTYDARDDVAMVAQMKAGSNLLFTSTSKRGTVLKDTYSLSGFTAAYGAITNACR